MKALAVACSTLLIAAFSGAVPVPKGAQPVNLVVNGSFEDGKDDEVSKPLDKGSTAIMGWVVTRGQIDVTQENGNEWKAAHGKRALDLHGSPGFGGVEQTIASKPGRKYQVTFRMSGNPGVEHKKVQIGVRAAGQPGHLCSGQHTEAFFPAHLADDHCSPPFALDSKPQTPDQPPMSL